MANETMGELKRAFDEYYAKAMDAKKKDDYYNLVQFLRKAGECQLKMAELTSDSAEKFNYTQRGRKYLENAKDWEMAHPEAFANTSQGPKQSTALKISSQDKTGTSFDDIIGCEDVKSFVKTQYIKRFSEKYKTVFAEGRGGTLERGMLLFGLPGTGKTMLARAIATEVDADFIAIKASDLKDRFYGDTEKKIQELYDGAAEKGTMTIIFIDEIETLLPSRSGSDIQNYEASAVTQFLAVLDGFEKEKMSKIITIAASNYPNRIDAAAIRPGRLGAWFRVDLPNGQLRKKLINKHFSKGYTLESDALDYLVANTKGYSSADVVSLCNRLKGKLAENGMEAVDKGLSDDMVLAISSKIVLDDAQDIVKVSNSSISMSSVSELEQFEINYNFKCAGGGIREYMANLD